MYESVRVCMYRTFARFGPLRLITRSVQAKNNNKRLTFPSTAKITPMKDLTSSRSSIGAHISLYLRSTTWHLASSCQTRQMKVKQEIESTGLSELPRKTLVDQVGVVIRMWVDYSDR